MYNIIAYEIIEKLQRKIRKTLPIVESTKETLR